MTIGSVALSPALLLAVQPPHRSHDQVDSRQIQEDPRVGRGQYARPQGGLPLRRDDRDVRRAVRSPAGAHHAIEGTDLLDKVIDGKKTPMRFTILFSNPDFQKYLTMYKEDAKKAASQVDAEVAFCRTGELLGIFIADEAGKIGTHLGPPFDGEMPACR